MKQKYVMVSFSLAVCSETLIRKKIVYYYNGLLNTAYGNKKSVLTLSK